MMSEMVGLESVANVQVNQHFVHFEITTTCHKQHVHMHFTSISTQSDRKDHVHVPLRTT